MARVYQVEPASHPLRISAISLLIVLAAACAPATPGPPAFNAGTALPGPRVVTRVAGSAAAPSPVPPAPGTPATNVAGLPVVAVALVRVRAGPGTTFDTIGLIQQGEEAIAIGRSASGEWLLVESPAVANGKGWIFRDLAQVEGDTSALPVVQADIVPTPPPPPAFTLPPEVTQTPLPPGAPTLTPTSTLEAAPIPPQIGLYADTLKVDYAAPCTYLRWIAKPAQAVYLDGKSMVGQDFTVVCPRIPSQTYVLEVVTLDGNRARLTLTIENTGVP